MRRRKDHLSIELELWGEWVARPISGLGFPSMSMEGRCIEEGLQGYSQSSTATETVTLQRIASNGKESAIAVIQEKQLTAKGKQDTVCISRPLHYWPNYRTQKVNEAVLSIPKPEWRQVINLRHVFCLGEDEIAVRLNISARRVRQLMNQVRIWLGSKLNIIP